MPAAVCPACGCTNYNKPGEPCSGCGTKMGRSREASSTHDEAQARASSRDFGGGVSGTGGGGTPLPGIGDIVDGYEVKGVLGEGGMGVVYKVADALDLGGHEYAMKVMRPEIAMQQGARERFLAEVSTLIKLEDHRHIVGALAPRRHGDLLLFLMRYVPGRSLRAVIDESCKTGRRCDPKWVVRMLGKALSALEYAHSRPTPVIHRDFTPENIMLCDDTDDPDVRVLDFGIAKVISHTRFSSHVRVMGKAYYLSPEQLYDPGAVDARSDVFTAGVLLYELLTGSIPLGVRNPRPSEINQDVPKALDEVAFRATALNPAERYQSASELSEALGEALRGPRVTVGDDLSRERDGGSSSSSDGDSDDGTLWREPITGMPFIWVPGGSFMMGSDDDAAYDDERPVHRVELDGFWLGKYPVTQAEYEVIAGTNPSHFSENGARHPVERVSWEEAKSFASELSGRHDYKYVFGLPSEAQWEYAARSGGKAEKYSGSDDPRCVAWCDVYNLNSTKPVGLLSSNGLGFHDMSGNVWEWCEDVYDSSAYAKHVVKNPLVTSGSSYRVYRGGSWYSEPWYVRSASRGWFVPADAVGILGFRLLRIN